VVEKLVVSTPPDELIDAEVGAAQCAIILIFREVPRPTRHLAT